MKTLGLLLALLALPLLRAHAQEIEATEGATIDSAQVSGLALSELSPGLQEAIGGLAGRPLDRQQLRDLAARIEAELPRLVAAVRAVRDPDGAVRVVFVVAPLRDKDREPNVNERYLVEKVEIRGVSESDLDQELRGALHALAGRRLDAGDADRLEARLKAALPDHDVTRRVMRGSLPGQVTLVFDLNRAESARWIPFEPSSKFVYHSKHGWGGYLGLPIGGRNVQLVPIAAINNADDLIEEYSGFGVRFESRGLGTERVGASLEWSTYEQTWEPATLAALALNPRIAPVYEDRSTVTPLVTFAFSPHVRASAGVSISELDALAPEGIGSQTANAGVFALGYSRRWNGDSGTDQRLDAIASLRAGTDALESDLVYNRYFGRAAYQGRWGRNSLHLSAIGGTLSGVAPLFERFSLGDSQTLRGWNKYDLAPAGGDRMWHGSMEYRYAGFALFLDTGAVWDHGTEARPRAAAGGGFHNENVFLTLGFPLNTDGVRAVFTMGIRY